jgi:hypothetical protein
MIRFVLESSWRPARERAAGGRGHLRDPDHRIDLDEPLSDIRGAAEVTVRPIQDLALGSPVAVLHALRALPVLHPRTDSHAH